MALVRERKTHRFFRKEKMKALVSGMLGYGKEVEGTPGAGASFSGLPAGQPFYPFFFFISGNIQNLSISKVGSLLGLTLAKAKEILNSKVGMNGRALKCISTSNPTLISFLLQH